MPAKILPAPTIFILLWSSLTLADTNTGKRISILNYGPGVAASAMGDAFAAGGDDMSAIHYNPSLLMRLDRSQLYGMHWFLFDNARYNFIGWAQLINSAAFGISATQLYRDGIEVRQNITDTPSNASASQVLIEGAFASSYERFKINYGAAIRYLTYQLYDAHASAFAGDFGLFRQLYRMGNPINHQITVNAGVNFQNLISSPLKLNEEDERYPTNIRGGLNGSITLFPRYSKDKENFSCDVFSLEVNADYFDAHSKYHFGSQYRFRDLVFLRLGWTDRVTAGFGFIWNDIQFDYAYLPNDFSTLHQVGMIYKFGKEMERGSQPFAEEFQSVYKKAQRIYERYFKDAAVLVEERKYQSASDLLFKAIPLLPKENSSAVELYQTCQKASVSESVNEQVSLAKHFESKLDYVTAYSHYLNALDIAPDDSPISVYLETSGNLMPSQQEKINRLKDDFYAKVSVRIESALNESHFSKAEKELKKLKILNSKSLQVRMMENRLADLKQLYTQRILTQAIRHLQEDRPDLAFQLYCAAYRLNPSDSMIKDQKYLAQNLYLKNRKYTLKDKIYADKLYYNTAIEFATSDSVKAVQTLQRLRSFNPVHDFIEEVEVPMIEKGIIK